LTSDYPSYGLAPSTLPYSASSAAHEPSRGKVWNRMAFCPQTKKRWHSERNKQAACVQPVSKATLVNHTPKNVKLPGHSSKMPKEYKYTRDLSRYQYEIAPSSRAPERALAAFSPGQQCNKVKAPTQQAPTPTWSLPVSASSSVPRNPYPRGYTDVRSGGL
jgi:hypothetical protein